MSRKNRLRKSLRREAERQTVGKPERAWVYLGGAARTPCLLDKTCERAVYHLLLHAAGLRRRDARNDSHMIRHAKVLQGYAELARIKRDRTGREDLPKTDIVEGVRIATGRMATTP